MGNPDSIPGGLAVLERSQPTATIVCAVVAVVGLPATLYSAYAAYRNLHPETVSANVPVGNGGVPAMINAPYSNYSFLALSILGALATLLAVVALGFFVWRHFHKEPEQEDVVPFFTPLQMEAFHLARELRVFLSGLGNRPDNVSSQDLWLSRLIHTYALDYAPRVKSLMHRFGIKDIFDLRLQDFIETVTTDKDVSYVANALVEMACRIEFVYLMDEGARQ